MFDNLLITYPNEYDNACTAWPSNTFYDWVIYHAVSALMYLQTFTAF